MRFLKLWCVLGFHRYKDQPIFEYHAKDGALLMSLVGRVCKDCGVMHPDALAQRHACTRYANLMSLQEAHMDHIYASRIQLKL
jgi:hypothetical protein